MPYSTAAEVEVACGGPAGRLQLCDLNNDGVEDAGVIDAAILEADTLIESYAKKRWEPGSIPTTINKLSARMAARILRRNRRATIPQDVVDEKNDREWLDALATGKVTAVDAGATKSALVVDKAGERDPVKLVSRERTKGFW